MLKSIVFGGTKGFGESILIQYDKEKFGIIDSFINQKTKRPCVLDFIEEENINPEWIKFIVLTHYHQDHFTGIAQVLSICTNAFFYTSNSLVSKNFQLLIAAHSTIESKHNFFREFEEIVNILKSTNRKIKVLSDSSKYIINEQGIKISSLSPNQDTYDYLDSCYKQAAKDIVENNNIKLQIGKKFNFQSVVILVESTETCILYGSDLEYSESSSEIGWEAIIKKGVISKIKFDLFKIPHHGSLNGYNKKDWVNFMNDGGIFNITPYSRGRSRLPKTEMIKNVLAISKEAYITSTISYEKIPSNLRKKLKGLDIKRLSNDIGQIEVNLSTSDLSNKIVLKGKAKRLAI